MAHTDITGFMHRGSNRFGKANNSFVDLNYSFSNEQSKNNYEYNYFDGFSNIKRERDYSDYSQRAFNFDLFYKLNQFNRFKILYILQL